MANDNRSGSTFGAFVLGGATGAVLALLYAPARGSTTRRRLRHAGAEIQDRTVDILEESQEQIRAFVADSEQRIAELVRDARAQIAAAIEEVSGS